MKILKNVNVIILNHNGGQLANQLWNYISIYAYCIEKGFECRNYCFFEYGQYFTIPVKNIFINILFYRSFSMACIFLPANFIKKAWRKIYKIYSRAIKILHPDNIIYSRTTKESLGSYALPPSVPATKELSLLENSNEDIYFDGWLFRNTVGIINYRSEIIKYFQPKKNISKNVRDFIDPIKNKFKHTIGIHIRQKDYRNFKSGRFFVDQRRIADIIHEYINTSHINMNETCFVMCSDDDINKSIFSNLNIIKSTKSLIEDLFILSSCDIILGSDSTFGNIASYFGNISHVIFKKDKIDWDYYKDKKQYFNNKYCLSVCNDNSLWSGY